LKKFLDKKNLHQFSLVGGWPSRREGVNVVIEKIPRQKKIFINLALWADGLPFGKVGMGFSSGGGLGFYNPE